MHVEVEGENGFFPPIASNSYILHAIVSRLVIAGGVGARCWWGDATNLISFTPKN